MKILIACEESQAVCKAFRERGHIAFSCDIQECSGGYPEWHILGDVLPYINGNCKFQTMDRKEYEIKGKWDLLIAHPPCTYLSTAATRSHSMKAKENSLESIATRTMKRIEAMQFFMAFINADCEKIAVENPTGVMNTCYRRPDCIVHPWYYATDESDAENYNQKRTQFWLKALPGLTYDLTRLKKPEFDRYENGKPKNFMNVVKNPKLRSKTFPGIAKAMAEQWG